MVSFGGATPAMMKATPVIPIVFTIDADPVREGAWSRLSRVPAAMSPACRPNQPILSASGRTVARDCPEFSPLGGLTTSTFSAPRRRSG